MINMTSEEMNALYDTLKERIQAGYLELEPLFHNLHKRIINKDTDFTPKPPKYMIVNCKDLDDEENKRIFKTKEAAVNFIKQYTKKTGRLLQDFEIKELTAKLNHKGDFEYVLTRV